VSQLGQFLDGPGLISICQENDIPARILGLGTRTRKRKRKP
jgi:hypothetical protein